LSVPCVDKKYRYKLARDAISGAAAKLDEEDRPLLSMLLDACTMPDVAAALRLPLDEAAHRIQRVIGRLQVAVPGG
jgi:hypothetical protein